MNSEKNIALTSIKINKSHSSLCTSLCTDHMDSTCLWPLPKKIKGEKKEGTWLQFVVWSNKRRGH